MKLTKDFIVKWLFITIGTISLVLGLIGIVIPLLPTTPFLLLSSFLYYRSSKRLYTFLTQNKVCGKYLSNYLEKKSITKKDKILTLLFLFISMGYGIYATKSIHLEIFLVVVLIAVTIHILLLKTLVPVKKTQLT